MNGKTAFNKIIRLSVANSTPLSDREGA